jgi:hypothetical protein
MPSSSTTILVLLVASIGCQQAVSSPAPAPKKRLLRPGALKVVGQNETQSAALSSELSKHDGRAEAWFLIENGGNREVTVTLASKTCTCVDLTLDGTAVAVGATFPLAVGQRKRIEASGRLSPAPAAHRFGAELKADDGSVVTLLGSRTVYADLDSAPNLLTVPMQRGEPVGTAVVEITHTFRSEKRSPPPPPTIPAVPKGVTVVSISPQHEPKELQAGLWQQAWDANLRLELREIAKTPTHIGFVVAGAEVRVPIKVTQGFGIVAPEVVTFGSVDLGSRRKRRVVMHSVGGAPFRVEKTKVDSDEVETSITASGDGRYWVDLIFQPVEAGERRARLLVETNHPDSPQVAIELIGHGRTPTGGSNQ